MIPAVDRYRSRCRSRQRLAIVAWLGLSALAGDAPAVIITVDTAADVVADDGLCSLREAIASANLDGGSSCPIPGECAAGFGPDTIAFAIPGTGPHTIEVLADLPAIFDDLTIDGTTQPGSDCVAGDLRLELDGSAAAFDGLVASSGNVSIRGLAINRFPRHGLFVRQPATAAIECSFIGTDITGTLDRGNGDAGIAFELDAGGGHRIGGPSPGRGNVIAGNDVTGIFIPSMVFGVVIEGNRIGTDVSGTSPLPNGPTGIHLAGGLANTIGGLAPGAGNLIANHAAAGIRSDAIDATDNAVVGNRIESNGAGIELIDGTITSLAGNCFTFNDLAVDNTSGTATVADGNWWGHPSGPGGAAPGQGDRISDDVTVGTFLTAPPAGCSSLAFADLALGLVESRDPVVAGAFSAILYEVTLTNRGPDAVTGVTVFAAAGFQSDITITAVTPSAGTYTAPDWTLPPLAVGASETLVFELEVGPGAMPEIDAIGFTAGVSAADGTLINTGDDIASEATSISAGEPIVPVEPDRVVATDGSDPDIAWNGDTLFVVWVADDGDGPGVFGRLLDATGAPVGGELAINSTTADEQHAPAVAFDTASSAVVVWQSEGQDGSGSGVFAQRFTTTGTRLGSEFQVNGIGAGDQLSPDLTVDPDSGELLAVWHSGGARGVDGAIVAQRFAAGTRLGSELVVNTMAPAAAAAPAAGSDGEGGTLVAWQDEDGSAIAGQHLTAGTRLGSELRVDGAVAASARSQPAVTGDGGDFVVVWRQEQAGEEQIAGQRLRAGTRLGSELRLDDGTAASARAQPAIAVARETYFVAWRHQDAGGAEETEVSGRLLRGAVRLGSELQLNSTVASRNAAPAVVFTSPTELYAVWERTLPGEEGSEVRGRRFEIVEALAPTDVFATMTVAGDFELGGIVVYTITLINAGTVDQPDNPGDELVDLLPPQLALIAVDSDAGRLSMRGAGGGMAVTWNGAIPAGGTVTITITAQIIGGAPGETVENRATVFFDADGDGSNESSRRTQDPTGGATGFEIAATVPVFDIPTLGPHALAFLAALLALLALARLRRR